MRYLSEDGRVFNTEEECRNHEREVSTEKKIEKLKKTEEFQYLKDVCTEILDHLLISAFLFEQLEGNYKVEFGCKQFRNKVEELVKVAETLGFCKMDSDCYLFTEKGKRNGK